MTRQRHGAPAAVLLAGLAAVLWFFAPAQLGGAASYTATVGTSMEPLFHKGDLAITKPASTYRVGDVVLYESPVFNRPVLHRILVIQHGHYFFKGDNNGFVDPGYVTRDRLPGNPTGDCLPETPGSRPGAGIDPAAVGADVAARGVRQPVQRDGGPDASS